MQDAGVKQTEKHVIKNKRQPMEENECDVCRANLYISWIRTVDDDIYCLQHALEYLNSNRVEANQCKIIYSYKEDGIKDIINRINEKLSMKKKSITKK